MQTKKPMYKETVGAQYYAFNQPTEAGEFQGDSSKYDEVIKTDVVKKIGTTENGESTTIRASGKDYDTVSRLNNVDLAVEVVAFPADDLGKMKGEEFDEDGLISAKTDKKLPFFAYGKVVEKHGGHFRFDWYPKCQLVENTDDIATTEENFSEQNDTVTIRAYAFDKEGHYKRSVDSEASNFPSGLTEEKFFAKPILTKQDLADALSSSI